MYSLNMMEICLILAKDDLTGNDSSESEKHQNMAITYLQYFLEISEEMNKGKNTVLSLYTMSWVLRTRMCYKWTTLQKINIGP